MGRTFQEEKEYLQKINATSWRIKKGFVPNMNVRLPK